MSRKAAERRLASRQQRSPGRSSRRGTARTRRRRKPTPSPPTLDELGRAFGYAFGHHLRRLRQRAGLSQGDLAGECYDRSFIAKLESGASLPSLDTLTQLAAVLGVNRSTLIPGEL